jgi:serine/threonine protein kinase
MDTERNLLFGVVAFQNGAVEADRLAETCADWASQPSRPLADLLVDRGLITDEQRTEVEHVVRRELASHGGDAQATLAATMDGRSREVIGEISNVGAVTLAATMDGRPIEAIGERPNIRAGLMAGPSADGVRSPVAGGHEVLGTISPEGEDHDPHTRYTLTHLHAKGGMGRVWLARDASLGRQIALKDLRPDQSDNSIVCSRFLYEAKITAQLEHPGIVPVYELGEGDSPYYTMRFVRGKTLSESIRAYHKKRAAGEVNSVEMVELLTRFVSVCHAVAYAHSKGIIHRDLKGQNVVVGDFGEVIVLDWGLAKRVGPDESQMDTGTFTAELATPDPDPDPAAAAQGQALDDLPKSRRDDETVATQVADAEDGDRTYPEGFNGPVERSSLPNGHSNGSAHANGSAYGSGAGSSANGHAGRLPESGAGPEGTMQGQLLGTPAYMAPEQAQARHDLVDRVTDVYGLGAILYEILTGRPPFVAPRTAEILRKVTREEPVPPRQIVPYVAPGLQAICLKALRKPKDERYASASELAQDVQRWLADEPVYAYSEPWTAKARRWARRHKTAVSTAAGLLVTATVALGVSTFLISQEKQEAEAQGQQARQAVNLLTKVADIGFDEQLDPLQKEFLEKALAYYEQFTGRVANNPAVKREHGRAHQQMGDILRKLGKVKEAENSYLKAIALLEPLAEGANGSPESKQALARTQTLLADLLVRIGADKGKAEPLYARAAATQQAIVKENSDATAEDRLRLGQTLKSHADLMRLEGKFTTSETVYDQAISELGAAHALDKKGAEARNELALGIDARGLVRRELGKTEQAENDFRRALGLLDGLVTEYPTIPRYRESLAKACNDLGIIEETSGRLDAAEVEYRRELGLMERLTQDYPDRPEYGRRLAHGLLNLGNALARQRNADAEAVLRRGIEVSTPLAAKNQDDVEIRFNLGRAHQCLGDLLKDQGNFAEAKAAFTTSRDIDEALAKEFPDKPRYARMLGLNLTGLAVVANALGQSDSEKNFAAAEEIYDKLIAAYPDNLEYRLDQSVSMRLHASVLAAAGKPEQAEAIDRKAVALLDKQGPDEGKPELLRVQAATLSNLGLLGRAGAEEALARSIRISEDLVARRPSVREDRHNLAIAQNNLGSRLLELKKPNDARAQLERSAKNFEVLVTEAPNATDYHSHFGITLGLEAKSLAQTGKPAEAKDVLQAAVEQQRKAVDLSRNGPAYRELLSGHLIELAEVDIAIGMYDEAVRLALEVPKIVTNAVRPGVCLQSARVLAHIVARVGDDKKLAEADRERLTRKSLGRTLMMLREAIDADPNLAAEIKKDADFTALNSRPEFKGIMDTLVNAGQ